VSVIYTNNHCGIAQYVDFEKTSDLRSFMTSWQRPINLKDWAAQPVLDANTNKNFIYLLDILKLYDWRGDYPNQGYMYFSPDSTTAKNHWWFWAYYNIKNIRIDMNPANIMTNLHYGGALTHKLSDISTMVELYSWPQGTKNMTSYPVVGGTFQWYTGTDGQPFNMESKEADVEAYMGLIPEDLTKKQNFGCIVYDNNGENVTEFDVEIPVYIDYEWGTFKQTVKIHIDTTHGNDKN